MLDELSTFLGAGDVGHVEFTSIVMAWARFAIIRSWYRLIDRSPVATMHQLGLDFHAGDSISLVNESTEIQHLGPGHEVSLVLSDVCSEVGVEDSRIDIEVAIVGDTWQVQAGTN